MHPLTKIVCGDFVPSGAVGHVLKHLSDSLDQLLARSLSLKKSENALDLALFGPMLGRAIVEVSFTAILARLDPFRVLAIRQSQISSGYDLKIRNPLAFNWSADVQGEEKPKEWNQRPSTKEIQRALLCRHYHDIFWEEAFTNFLDAASNDSSGWLTDLKKINPEGFTVKMRAEADWLYSELSKGIHHEFVIPATAQYDSVTVIDLIARSWQLVAALGITTCFSPIVRSLTTANPIECLESAQGELYS